MANSILSDILVCLIFIKQTIVIKIINVWEIVMKGFKAIRWLLTMACVVVCLMGINYAYFTGQLNISSKIESANMKYSDGGLDITLHSEATNHLMNLAKDGSYSLTYSLNSNNKNNIPLKKIENESIGNISIKLENVKLTQDGKELDSSFIYNRIPNILGTFDCYHDFDGVNGTITMIKQSEPTNLNVVINKNELSKEAQILLGIEESLDKKVIIDNTIVGKEIEKEIEITESIQLEQEMYMIESIKIEEELMERAILTIDATYGFQIPLEYDQFNANVN